MRILVFASLALMGLVCVGVGLRLTALARRTRQLPETLMGGGLLLVTIIGMPLSVVGRSPEMIGTPLGDGLFTVGLAVALVGIACFYAFTWQVFRLDSAWSLFAVMLACGALGAAGQGLIGASVGSNIEEVYAHTRPWAMATVALVATAYVWSGAEALTYWRRMRRRLALGLAEPEVVNRFWLWGAGSLAVATQSLGMLVPMYFGVAPLSNLPTLLGIGVASVVSSCCWLCAFLPPEAYLERVRGRAEAGTVQAQQAA